MSLNTKQKEFIQIAKDTFNTDVLTTAQLKQINQKFGLKSAPQWITKNANYKVGKSQFKLPSLDESINTDILSDKVDDVPVVKTVAENVQEEIKTEAAYVVSSLVGNIVPKKDATFVSFGNYKDLKSIVNSEKFYPVFVTGLSGNGKTMGITQACAETKRELVRVNITIETDEDDLLGGYRLKDGDTVWQNGPVIEAMQRGAVLLLDEIDLASNKIMCLQPILEGNGVFVKKINKFVAPQPGFQVFATANTKGQGSDDGKFIGTNVLNEAFLERFPITFEQSYPKPSVEEKILQNVLSSSGKSDNEFCKKLVTWADVIRKTYFDGGVDEIISTRRLVHIVQAFTIFNDRLKSIELCTNRFDDETKNSFVDLYTKVDSGATSDQIMEEKSASDLQESTNDANDSEANDEEVI
jgi:MoxR-like ATPase